MIIGIIATFFLSTLAHHHPCHHVTMMMKSYLFVRLLFCRGTSSTSSHQYSTNILKLIDDCFRFLREAKEEGWQLNYTVKSLS